MTKQEIVDELECIRTEYHNMTRRNLVERLSTLESRLRAELMEGTPDDPEPISPLPSPGRLFVADGKIQYASPVSVILEAMPPGSELTLRRERD